MKVDNLKKEYKDFFNIWTKCRDVVSGQEVLHEKGEVYLPKLLGQTQEEYRAYVDRALFYNASARTVDAMTGMLFRKQAQIEVPSGMKQIINDIDLNGNDINSFVQMVAEEIMIVGRCGLLVDFPFIEIEENSTKAEIDDNFARPFVSRYVSEDIINWRTTNIGGKQTLTFIVLKEVHEDYINEFEVESHIKYRVLDIKDNKYRQRLFAEINKSFELLAEIYPTKRGEYMKEIPFVMVSPRGICADILKPPLLDLINVNLSHYKTSADVEHGSHFTGLPTAVVTGHAKGDGEVFKIGSASAWVFSESEARASYLEFTGQGLSALEDRLTKKEDYLATLGARMLLSEKAYVESVETHKLKRQGENSAMAALADGLDEAICKVLEIMRDWYGVSGVCNYVINKDFTPEPMSHQKLIALLQVWQSGGMSFNDFVRAMHIGEIIDNNRSAEDILEDLSNESPALGSDLTNEAYSSDKEEDYSFINSVVSRLRE